MPNKIKYNKIVYILASDISFDSGDHQGLADKPYTVENATNGT